MNRPIPALAALLAVQLLLAAGLAAAARRSSAREAPLLGFDPKAIDRIVVEGPSGARVTVARGGGGWVLPELGDFPAEAGKADRLLSRLAELRHGAPVATSAEAALRFKVADGDFERRITLEAGGKAAAAVLVGTAAAMRSVHARAGGSAEVHLVPFSAWEAPATAAEWLDRGILRIPRSEIEAIEAGGVKIERAAAASPPPGAAAGAARIPAAPDAPSWRATGLPSGASLDASAAEALVSAVADLSVKGVLGTEPKPAWGLDRPAIAVAVRRAGGSTVEYRLAKPAGAQDWVLKASTRPEYLEVPAHEAEALRKAADPRALAGRRGAGAAAAPKPPGAAPAARAAR